MSNGQGGRVTSPAPVTCQTCLRGPGVGYRACLVWECAACLRATCSHGTECDDEVRVAYLSGEPDGVWSNADSFYRWL